MQFWFQIRAGHLSGYFEHAGTMNNSALLLISLNIACISFLILWVSYLFCKCLLQVHPMTQLHPRPLPVCLLPPAESEQRMTQIKKGLLSAEFDNLSLRASLIIHASLTGYLLSFCIKRRRKVEGYVAIINFPVTQQRHFYQAKQNNIS